jgi:heptose-I-phosphate ethanolaminephosphotransferase
MFKNIKPYIILLFPIVLKYLFLLIFSDFERFSFADFYEDLIFFIIVSLALNISKKRVYTLSILVIYVIYFVLEGTSYLAVHSNFTSSFMYVLIESSQGEFKEFLQSYISFSIILFISLLILSFFLLKRLQFKGQLIKGYLSFLFVLILIFFLKFTGLIENNCFHNVVRGVYGYYQLQNNFNLNKSVTKEDIDNVKNNDVLVFVLGESTTRNHMGLYGYNRETTPLLSAFKDSLFVYNDVISTDVLTLKSVPKMLTSKSNDLNNIESVDLINIFNQAGFKTYWLSNQRPISYNDNAISKIASNSRFFKFYNYKIDKYATSWDEVMLPKYNEILNSPEKKVIVIRLLGTHFDYYKRYPSSFNKFQTKNSSEKEAIINQYDNAVLYNDFIVKSILESLKKINKKTALIYISDHGENVYDEADFFGRNEDNLTKSMFDIPFFVWTSNSFDLPDDFEFAPDRKFMADHLYESVGHLLGVKYKDMDFSKSIFSKNFKNRKRIVVNGINYDEYFVKKNE